MGEIAKFVPKSEIERIRLIREARAIYDSIFPSTDAVGERPDDRPAKSDATWLKGPLLRKETSGWRGAHSPLIAILSLSIGG
jgi:hypothetical protein